LVSDESFDIDSLESNHRLGLRRALECFLAAAADGQDCPGPIGSAPELAEAVALAPVDPDPSDTGQRKRLFYAGDLLQLAGRRHEEAHAGTTALRDRRDAPRRDRLAESGRDRGAVQIDAEGNAAQLGVMAPADPGCQLADSQA